MIISHDITPFRRFGLVINETLWIDGMPYFTAAAIADALELKNKDDGVQQIVRRNPYILRFSKEITVLSEEIEIPKSCRPFSLTGQCPINNPEIANMIRLWGGGANEKKSTLL
jgi:hypothetical protein